MAPRDMPTETNLTSHTHSGTATHLQGQEFASARLGGETPALRAHWLLAARVLLLTVSALALLLYVVGTPVYFDRLYPSHTDCIDDCLTPARVQALHALGISITTYAAYWLTINLLFALMYFAVAALIFWRKSDDRMALFASFFLVALGASFPSIPSTLAAVYPAWWLPVALLNALSFPSLTVFLFLFPNGRFVPRWTRWVALGFTALYVIGAFFPGSILSFTHWPRLLSLPVPLAWLGSMVFAQVHRYQHVSTPVERQQTKWVVFGTVIALIGFLLLAFVPLALLPFFFPRVALLPLIFIETSIYLLLLLIPLSVAIAILRYRLWDIDSVINRTLVYGGLTACIIGLYALVVGALGALFQTQSNVIISLLAAGLIAVVFSPLRDRLQRTVNRLMYGKRDEPYTVLTQLGQRLETTLAPDAVLPTIVESVAQALKLPYAALALKQDGKFTIAATYGLPTETPLRLPLVYQTEQVGEFILAPRAPGDTFTAADHRLINDLARQIGVAAHAVRLTSDLQRSRERLVTTREEERRRLRRDLHDGLGPALAGLSLKVGAVRNLLPPNQSPADELLVELGNDIEEAVHDIRRIVYDLRPPSLDELGLVGAIRARAAQYNTSSRHGNLQVLIDSLDPLPPLPAAIEVAIYRIALEALTNVDRHAQAHTCRICLSLSDEVLLEVTDDGMGLPLEHHTGVGLIAMRERAAELGGVCVIEPLQPKGTRVLAHLPLPEFTSYTGGGNHPPDL